MFKLKSHSLSDPISLVEMPEEHPARLFYDYWFVLCEGKKFAKKSDFDPSKIPVLLPNIAIVQLHWARQKLDPVLKLAGERFYELGKVSSGQRVQDIFPEKEYSIRCSLYAKIAKQPQVSFYNMQIPFESREFINVKKGIFPFSSDNKKVDHLFLVID